MNVKVYCLLLGMFGLSQLAGPRLAQGKLQYTSTATFAGQNPHPTANRLTQQAPQYSKTVRFNIYSFIVAASDSGRVRELIIKAYRGELLLTNFHIRVDGAVVGAEVADLDNNRFPELYVYSASDGSGSFGRVYAWQFLPERKVDITLKNWQQAATQGYMGHDSLWIEHTILCRKYPVYQAGDANADPSGGYRMMRYHLQPIGSGFTLVAE